MTQATQTFEDHRTDRTDKATMYLCATDKFMSGWGKAPGKSYVAYPIYDDTNHKHIKLLHRWMDEFRPDFIRVRENLNLPRTSEGDHLSLYDLPSVEELKQRIMEYPSR